MDISKDLFWSAVQPEGAAPERTPSTDRDKWSKVRPTRRRWIFFVVLGLGIAVTSAIIFSSDFQPRSRQATHSIGLAIGTSIGADILIAMFSLCALRIAMYHAGSEQTGGTRTKIAWSLGCCFALLAMVTVAFAALYTLFDQKANYADPIASKTASANISVCKSAFGQTLQDSASCTVYVSNGTFGVLDSFYLSIANASTLGSGDITARTSQARAVIAGEMVADAFVLVGFVALFIGVARFDD